MFIIIMKNSAYRCTLLLLKSCLIGIQNTGLIKKTINIILKRHINSYCEYLTRKLLNNYTTYGDAPYVESWNLQCKYRFPLEKIPYSNYKCYCCLNVVKLVIQSYVLYLYGSCIVLNFRSKVWNHFSQRQEFFLKKEYSSNWCHWSTKAWDHFL